MEFDVEAFYVTLDRERRRRKVSWTQIAMQIDVAPDTVTRIGTGLPPSTKTLVRLLSWLGETDLKPFLTRHGKPLSER